MMDDLNDHPLQGVVMSRKPEMSWDVRYFFGDCSLIWKCRTLTLLEASVRNCICWPRAVFPVRKSKRVSRYNCYVLTWATSSIEGHPGVRYCPPLIVPTLETSFHCCVAGLTPKRIIVIFVQWVQRDEID